MAAQRFKITDKKTGKFLASYPLTFSISGAVEAFERAGYEVEWSWSEKHREFSKRLMPGVYYGSNRNANGGGWILLIRLGRYGLNLGTGFSGYWSLRSWDWARYDYADHYTYLNKTRWRAYPEGGN
jgi:hypothetical protein